MRGTLSPTKTRTGRTYQPTLGIVSTTLVGLAISLQPFAFAQVPPKTPDGHTPTQVTPASTPKTSTQVAKKPHTLIRRPSPTMTTIQHATASIDHPLSPAAPKPASPPTTPVHDEVFARPYSNDTFANPAMAPAMPILATPAGQPPAIAGAARAASSLAGNAATSTHTAAAAPASSTPAAPPSMRRLFAEIPGTAQIIASTNPAPPVTTPTILRNPTTLSFSTVQNGAAPATQPLTISNGGTGILTWTASSNSAWLTLNGASSVAGSNPGTIIVAVNPNGLAVGAHSGIITIGSPGAANTPQTLTVTFAITAAPTPTIGLSATSLSFTAPQGENSPAAKTVALTNSGTGTLNWTATENTSWLTLNPASGTGAGTLNINVSPTGLTAGTYSAPITIAASGATNTPSTVLVTLTVTAIQPSPTIGLSPASLSFTAIQGAGNPVAKTVTLTNTGSGTLAWSVSDNAAWLTLNATSGTTNLETDPITVTVNTAGLAAGTYNAAITLTATGGATNTPQSVPVVLTVTAPATSSATLTWNAVPDIDLAGYKVYRATATGGYGAPLATIPAGTVTYLATGLQTGSTYYFVITAYDTAGNESTLSNEVSKSIF